MHYCIKNKDTHNYLNGPFTDINEAYESLVVLSSGFYVSEQDKDHNDDDKYCMCDGCEYWNNIDDTHSDLCDCIDCCPDLPEDEF
jgi:hypothetical protein